MAKEQRSFQTETKKLLDLMIHSIYTNKEIFLRELVSNASDAIDKLKFKSLTENSLLKEDEELGLFIKADIEAKTLTISDNGIGMTREEVVENLGTIAKSGTENFIKSLENVENKENMDMELIGQFGVGFYSAFMVADKVTVVTKSSDSDKGIIWESTGDGTYTIEEIEKADRGTSITLHLKEKTEGDETFEDYTSEYILKNLITKYSNFVRYPVKMEVEKTEYPKKEDGSPDYEAEPTKSKEIETINAMKPIWLKNKNEVKDEEYNDFYKQTFHDWTDPLDVIHSKAEGTVEFTTLLFIPKKAPFDFNTPGFKKGIKLYSKNVFIKDKCEDLLPDYFKFVKGLVDSSDFSLNISREILQKTTQLKVIAKNIEKKVHDSLKYILNSERATYIEFWNEFGKILKNGIYADYGAKDKIADLLIFESSKTKDGEFVTLKEYVDRMEEGQEKIYFAVGNSKATIENSPQMEYFRDKDYEVLYFLDRIDEFITTNLSEFDGKKIQSISKGDVESSTTEEEKKEIKEKQESEKEILEAMKTILGESVKEVRFTNRLKTSPVCIVSGEGSVSLNMEKVLKDYDAFVPKAEKILEINPEHKLYTKIKELYNEDKESQKFKNYTNMLLDQALLMEGLTPANPTEFVNRLTELMVN